MTTPPPQQRASWAERIAIVREHHEMESRLTAPVSERMLELARLGPGMRVLDVASGMGEPSLRAARRVGPSGFVLGTDLVNGMLEVAREQARAQALSNIEFRAGDAETLELPEQSFDAATVRWALMYMPRPERALERLWRALRPSGPLVCASWGAPEQVEYASLPRRTMAHFRPRSSPRGRCHPNRRSHRSGDSTRDAPALHGAAQALTCFAARTVSGIISIIAPTAQVVRKARTKGSHTPRMLENRHGRSPPRVPAGVESSRPEPPRGAPLETKTTCAGRVEPRAQPCPRAWRGVVAASSPAPPRGQR